MTAVRPPYPSGLDWRVQEAERRLGRMEAGENGTITGDTRDDLREIKEEIRNLKRSFWGLTSAIGVLVAVLVQVFGR